MAQPINLATKDGEAIAAKLAAEITRLEQLKNDPSLTSPLAPYREQILKLKDELAQPFKAIAALLSANGLKTSPYAVSKFYDATKKKRQTKTSTATAPHSGK